MKIDKPAKQEKLRIVQLTDIHISEIVTPQFIQQMVDKVNRLNADLVVITGDTIDSRIDPFILLGFNKQFQQLKAKYGTYIIFGNHEYASIDKPNNSLENIATAYKSANMHLLKDDVLYDDKLGITLIGRNDYITEKLKTARASLDDLLLFTDPDAPIILLDHQPQDLNEPAEKGVDLMISGHTHGGQIFPVNLVVDYLYKNPHGIYVDPNHKFTSIVSSGYGLWGPPIRLMTRCEIVVIDLTFDKQADTLNKGEN
ncbi:metallophosphoesterase [Orbaceae bacterium ESL0721]|nr:metallophosphoesterase [Orbaceae bacterium ESL0721]